MYYGILILLEGKQYNVLWYFHTTGRKAIECTMVLLPVRKQQQVILHEKQMVRDYTSMPAHSHLHTCSDIYV